LHYRKRWFREIYTAEIVYRCFKDFNGSLLINSTPIGNYNLHSIREQTGIMFPDEDIFHGTLWENITMGKNGVEKGYIDYLCNVIGFKLFSC
jgi:ABC-type multidrug transport system fused ATPase/permease subunit